MGRPRKSAGAGRATAERGVCAAVSMGLRRSRRLADPRRRATVRCRFCCVPGLCASSLGERSEIHTVDVSPEDRSVSPQIRPIEAPVPTQNGPLQCSEVAPLPRQIELIDSREAIVVEESPCSDSPAIACDSVVGEESPVDPKVEFSLGLMRCMKSPYTLDDMAYLRKAHIIEGPEMELKKCLAPYPELMAELKSVAGDKMKVFRLLRGYMYWFHRRSKDGAFQPWMDPDSLAMMKDAGNSCRFAVGPWCFYR